MALSPAFRALSASLLGLAVAACAAPPQGPNAKPNPSRSTGVSPAAKPSVAGDAGASQTGLTGTGALGAQSGAGRIFLPLRLTPVIPAALLGNDGAALLANDGSSLLANDGSSLIANDGSSLIANDGGSLIGNDGAGILASGGGNVLASGGGNVLASGGGNYRLLADAAATPSVGGSGSLAEVQDKIWRQACASFAIDQMVWGWAKQKPKVGEWLRFTLPVRLLPIPNLLLQNLDPTLAGLLAQTVGKAQDRHLAAFLEEQDGGLKCSVLHLDSADAALSSGRLVFSMFSRRAGETEVRAQGLASMLPILDLFLVKHMSLKADYRLLPAGGRRISIDTAVFYRPLQEGDFLASGGRDALGVQQNAQAVNRAVVDVDTAGHIRLRFAEHQRALAMVIKDSVGVNVNFPETQVRFMLAAQSGSEGMAAWSRFAGNPLAGAPAIPMVQARPLPIYGLPSGALATEPSAALKALVPDDAWTTDPEGMPALPEANANPDVDSAFGVSPLSEAAKAAMDAPASGAKP